jgi:hypothetical protein
MTNPNEIPTYEAGALIQFSRVTGKANLFGSDFDHDHYITLKVTPCTTQRSSNRTWYMGTLKPYIEVSLSAAQFAETITTLNCGSGIPCTMEYLNGRGKFPKIEPIPQRPAFKAEGGEALAESIAAIDDTIAELDTLKLSVAAKKAMHGQVKDMVYHVETATAKAMTVMVLATNWFFGPRRTQNLVPASVGRVPPVHRFLYVR